MWYEGAAGAMRLRPQTGPRARNRAPGQCIMHSQAVPFVVAAVAGNFQGGIAQAGGAVGSWGEGPGALLGSCRMQPRGAPVMSSCARAQGLQMGCRMAHGLPGWASGLPSRFLRQMDCAASSGLPGWR